MNPLVQSRPRGFRADRGYSYAVIERLARDVRRVLGLVEMPRLNGLELFERLGRYRVRLGTQLIPLDYASNDLPEGVEALAMYDEGSQSLVIVLSPETYRRLQRGDRRALFSVCHELGHALLHTAKLIAMSRIPHRTAALQRGQAEPHEIYLDTEWQADAFAGALLMPARDIDLLDREWSPELTAEIVSRHFGVSLESSRIRLRVFKERRAELLI